MLQFYLCSMLKIDREQVEFLKGDYKKRTKI